MRGTLILAVEDLPEAPGQTALEECYDVLIARSDEEVTVYVETRVPEAVVVDLFMEGLDGLALCRSLRQSALTRTIPIVAVAAPNAPQSCSSAREAGADVCLSRPLDWMELQLYLQSLRKDVELDGLSRLLDGLSSREAEELVHLLSHDVKSPGSAAVSVLSMLVDSPDITDLLIVKSLRYALSSTQRQLCLIDEMLNLFCLLNNIFPLVIQDVDVGELVRRTLSAGEADIERKKMQVVDHIPAALPPAAADADLLQQVLDALLNNSLKFCVQGDALTIDARADRSRLTLTFTDTGRAVLPGYADALFDLKAQWQVRKHGSRASVACGLPFCRAALRAMQGEVRVRSDEDGSHTTFAVILPVYEYKYIEMDTIGSDTSPLQRGTHDEGNYD